MEGKKLRLSAAACRCLLLAAVVVLLSSGEPRQASAISEFCLCYKTCYAECRQYSGPYPCNFGCLQDCFNQSQQQPQPERPKSAADCDRICLIRVCGVMSSTAAADGGGGDADECLVDCRSSIGH